MCCSAVHRCIHWETNRLTSLCSQNTTRTTHRDNCLLLYLRVLTPVEYITTVYRQCTGKHAGSPLAYEYEKVSTASVFTDWWATDQFLVNCQYCGTDSRGQANWLQWNISGLTRCRQKRDRQSRVQLSRKIWSIIHRRLHGRLLLAKREWIDPNIKTTRVHSRIKSTCLFWPPLHQILGCVFGPHRKFYQIVMIQSSWSTLFEWSVPMNGFGE